MPTDKEIFEEKMDALADAINTKAGTSGAKGLDELRTTVEGISVLDEGVIAEEYDSTKSYTVGEYCLHETVLYRCTGTTTGTWDSSKWEETSVTADLINKYAQKDGYYGTLTSGYSDNLTPFSGDSGTSQNTPFILQGSGCANGEEQADTGSYCQLKEKRGNTVVVNQLVKNSDFSQNANWSAWGLSLNITGGEAIITLNNAEADSRVYQMSRKYIAGHKYILICIAKSEDVAAVTNMFYDDNSQYQPIILTSTYKMYADVITAQNTTNNGQIQICRINTSGITGTVYYKLMLICDLTLWFGSNDAIPTHLLNHPEDFFRYYQGDLSYNAGTLTDCNGRYLKTTGRNVCDEVFEGGLISGGSDSPNTEGFRTKNYQRVAPNTPYHLHSGMEITGYYVHEYDSDKNYIKSTSIYENNQVITLSPNTIFVRLSFWKSNSGWGSNVPAKDVAQIVLSLYYEGESGYDQYYPYEELANIDTGNEPLLAFDYKTPDGTIHRDSERLALSELTCVFLNYNYFATLLIPTGKGKGNNPNNYMCDDIECTHDGDFGLTDNVKRLLWNNSNPMYFTLYTGRDSNLDTVEKINTWLASQTNTFIEYELADSAKTTEQGTPFPENIAIDDFGTMAFDCPNGVPQGNTVFYPVDYKAEFDTLHNITEGDMHKIALKGELAPTDPDTIKGVIDAYNALYSINQENMGGTLRHVLVDEVTAGGGTLAFSNTTTVDLGSLNWTYNNTEFAFGYFQSDIISNKENSNNFVCSKYATALGRANLQDKEICIRNNSSSYNVMCVRDDGYTDATAFKAAMKGILLAYEKATT